jgi:hypothetical protein
LELIVDASYPSCSTERQFYAAGADWHAVGGTLGVEDRTGVIDVIHGSTSADTFAVAARGGYRVDVGPFRAGPIGGIACTRAVIDPYTE